MTVVPAIVNGWRTPVVTPARLEVLPAITRAVFPLLVWSATTVVEEPLSRVMEEPAARVWPEIIY